jgi:hypothetical protein
MKDPRSQRSQVNKLFSAQKDCFAPGGEATDHLEVYNDVRSYNPLSTPHTGYHPDEKRCSGRNGSPIKKSRTFLPPLMNQDSFNLGTKRRKAEEICRQAAIKSHLLSNAVKQLTAKLAQRRDGPYQIQKFVSLATYTDTLCFPRNPDKSVGKYNLSNLTLFTGHHRMTPDTIHPIRRQGRPQKKLSEAGQSSRTMGQTRRV